MVKMILVFKLAIALVLARLALAILPVVVGWLFTAVLAVLAPVTTLRYLFGRKKAPTPPLKAPLTIQESVDKYFADFAKQQGRDRN
jgi:hypothetical protein